MRRRLNLSRSDSTQIAWLHHDKEIFWVTLPKDSPRSPIKELIERIYHAESLRPVSRARAILRERIHANFSASIGDRETVKVAAKRMSAPTDRHVPTVGETAELPEAPALPKFEIEGLKIGDLLSPADVPAWLDRLKLKPEVTGEKWNSDRPVAAILVDASDRVIAYAWNTNAVIRTRHAEWNLCTELAGSKFPPGAKLYVSLKPCRMCAARAWESAADPKTLSVVYLENDPGALAQGTMLDAESPARLRYIGQGHPLFSAEISRLGL